MQKISLTLVVASIALAACQDAPGTELGEPGQEEKVGAATSALTSSDITGTWYLNANNTWSGGAPHGYPLTVTISGSGPWTGTLVNENGGTETVDNIAITTSPTGQWLEFRRDGAGFYQWYRGMVNQGVFAGRYAHQTTPTQPALSAYAYHATGWNAGYFTTSSGPIAWDITINTAYHAHLKLDNTQGPCVARLKIYASNGGNGLPSSAGEELENDLTVQTWDGTHLTFTRTIPGYTQVFTGTVSGRTIAGTYSDSGGTHPWSGTREEVLGYGIQGGWTASYAATRIARLRSRLYTLMMAGNPAATLVQSTLTPASNISGTPIADRDDNPSAWPQGYTMTQFTNVYSLTNAFDGGTVQRQVHGYIAQPPGSPPGGKWPVAIAVNGHSHSAYQLMNPASGEYAGDAFARRGYLVVAVDVSHRNDSPIYGADAYSVGDDPTHGNGPHPSIRTAALDSDWEEDGERAWDVMRAVDMVLAQSDVNPAHLVVTGLSMGGETSTIAGALNPRISMVVAAGFSPDLGVIQYNGNHACWGWAHANIRDFIDVSDYEEAVAPRPFIIETGKQDNTFSAVAPYFESDKQVARRARVPYADLGVTGSYVHYLHYGFHQYHLGDASQAYPTPLGVQIPDYIAPVSPNHLSDWQTDGTTYTGYPTVFQAIGGFLP